MSALMKNRIRHYRRQRQMTLKQLAQSVGTTPQTVSRLETEVMTLSTDWLERMAQALGVHASDLLDTPDRPDIPILGFLGANGALTRPSDGDRLIFSVRTEHPIAIRLTAAYGPYRSGELLVGTKLEGGEMAKGIGRDCICCLAGGKLVLRRLVRGDAGSFTLVSLAADGEVLYNQELLWAARVIVRLEYL
jgi:transcriptional regulator with XRE-family HTH domain